MEAVARGKYLKSSARKMRAVADMIRDHSVESSLAILFAIGKSKKSARMVEKVLKSAIANIKENNADKQIETEKLKIKTITVDAGPLIKRIRARAQGRAFRIHKKLCHLTLAISD